MSSVEHLREFVSERLTAAAEEIFGVFKQTILEYEKEIDRQRRLLDIVWKPEVKLHRIKLQQQHVYEQQLCIQESNSMLDQEDPRPPQMKAEQDESCTGQEGDQTVLKQGTFVLTTDFEDRDHSEELQQQHVYEQQLCIQESNSMLDQEDPRPPQMKEEQDESCTGQEGDQTVLKQGTFVLTTDFEDRDHSEVKNQDQEGGERGDSESTTNVEQDHRNQHHDRSHSNNEYTITMSEMNCNTAESSLMYDTCGKDLKCTSKSETIHTGEELACSCKICGKDFQCVSDLKGHMTVHIGEKRYTCRTCQRAFRWSCDLTVHIRRVHTGEKPYLCKTCGKRFTEKSALTIHMRIHTDERPYTCQICGKAYRQSSTLTNHIRTHTGEKPHLCSTCGKRFITMSLLRRHTRIHTGEKPYTCNTCGRAFGRSGHLAEHIRRAHTAKKL